MNSNTLFRSETLRRHYSIDPPETGRPWIQLNNAGIAPLTREAVRAGSAILKAQGQMGFASVPQQLDEYEKAHSTIANYLGTPEETFSITPNVAYALNQVAFGLDLRKEDEIVLPSHEYPSNAYPWFAVAQKTGTTLKRIEVESFQAHFPTDAICNAIGPKTRVVALSLVSYLDGAMPDMEKVRKKCSEFGSWLVVDVAQAAGIVPLKLREMGIDAAAGCVYKWLCGPIGMGFLALPNRAVTELEPLVHGTFTYGTPDDSASPEKLPRQDRVRFEPAAPPIVQAVAAAASVEVLSQFDSVQLAEHAEECAGELFRGLKSQGWNVFTPSRVDPFKSASPFVVALTAGKTERVSRALDAAQIVHTARHGTIRLSPHGFSRDLDISAAVEAFKADR